MAHSSGGSGLSHKVWHCNVQAKVFESAEEQHKLFLEEIQRQEDQGFGEDGDHFQENSMRGIGTASYDGH